MNGAHGDWSACRHDDDQNEPCSAHRPVTCAEGAMGGAHGVTERHWQTLYAESAQGTACADESTGRAEL